MGGVLASRTVTYGRIFPKYDRKTWLTVVGHLIGLLGDVITPTAYLITSDLVFNSVLSTKNQKFMCADIAKFRINNPMDRYEYMNLPLYIIP